MGDRNDGRSPLLAADDSSSVPVNRTFEVYPYRWIVLAVYILAAVANAVVLLTWAPITDKAQTYWNDIDLTAVNILSVAFQVCYVPGTLFGLWCSERYALRGVLLIGGALTTVGCLVRLLGAVAINSAGTSASYGLILFGTILVGLAQPFYLNMPAKIAATWFGVSERDIATTMCSLGNPLGSAVGSILPAMFVTGDSDHAIKTGILGLLTTQAIISIVAIVITFFFFRSRPDTPASASAEQMQIIASTKALNTMFDEMVKLVSTNTEYRKLLFSFTIVLGNLNAIAALLNQLPGGYSNGTVGLTGAVLILTGFAGAFGTGFVLDYTKAYTQVLKCAYVLTFLSWLFFFANCRGNNTALFVFSAAVLGGCTLPTIPSTIVSAVECSYPIAEDTSLGLLYMSANVTAILLTLMGQLLLSLNTLGPAPLFPYAIFVGLLLLLATVPVLTFKGSYFRLQQDTKMENFA
ncbi:MFS transporter [archaeon]|nr:MAG: MFS transporter [archaeon]